MHTGLIVQPTYRVRGGQPVVQLWGRTSEGPPFLVEDDRFRPYFFVRKRDADALRGVREAELRDTELHDLRGEPLVRVSLPVPGAVRPLRDKLISLGVVCLEADVRFAYRYLMDHSLHTSIAIHGRVSSKRQGGTLYFHNPELGSAESNARLTHLSLDLETTPNASAIYSAALVGCETEEVHLVAAQPVRGAVVHADEKTLLVALAARIRALDPDVLLGWNVVDFDLAVLDRRFRELGVKPRDAIIGRAPGRIDFQSDRGFGRQNRASVPGRMVLDGIPLVRDALRLEDYRLETVARAVLGRGKLIDATTQDAAAEITRQYLEEPEALVAYNLEDARLVPQILEQEGLLDLALERSLLTGMQLDRVGASIACFDLLYLPELRLHGRAAPSVDVERSTGPVTGGAVLEPSPGLVHNVAVYDFKSLYPSLMRTFNIDPLALAEGSREPAGAAIVAPNGAHLSRREAILPRVLERFMERRAAARERGDRHADQAIKIMMNSMFGIFAAPACRFFSPELANAITTFGQQTLAWTRAAFLEEGMSVIYGDTDSVFVKLPETGSPSDTAARAEQLRRRVADKIAARIQHDYDVEAKLDLELEKIYAHFFLPRVRGGGGGSKKRYAGWVGDDETGRLEVVGLESIRRDWPAVARRLQEGMLTRLFHDQDLLPFTQQVIEGVLSGELDAELVYAKRIRKGSLDRYTASSPPHVQAARKLEERTGQAPRGVIRYVITPAGPEPIQHGETLPENIDRRHYIERVLRPVGENILSEVGLSFSEALGEPQQLDLLFSSPES
ncbi:MAG: DNA polymerase II [Deltaproteobacteria bacterium]|nr:DNA polymerase II [Deltaproteobacteria bacterium]